MAQSPGPHPSAPAGGVHRQSCAAVPPALPTFRTRNRLPPKAAIAGTARRDGRRSPDGGSVMEDRALHAVGVAAAQSAGASEYGRGMPATAVRTTPPLFAR